MEQKSGKLHNRQGKLPRPVKKPQNKHTPQSVFKPAKGTILRKVPRPKTFFEKILKPTWKIESGCATFALAFEGRGNKIKFFTPDQHFLLSKY